MKRINMGLHLKYLNTISVFVLLVLLGTTLEAQKALTQVDIQLGHIVPNFPEYPSAGLVCGLGLSIEQINQHKSQRDIRLPKVSHGLFFGYRSLGNNRVFGQEAVLYPYINWKLRERWHLKLGLGMAWFSACYSEKDNADNIAVGSSLTWAFETGVYWHKPLHERLQLIIGGQYLHGSNGHTQLPNFGINMATISAGIQFLPPTSPPTVLPTFMHTKDVHFQWRNGFGFHELGGTIGPTGGPKYGIFSSAIYVSKTIDFRNKLKTGFIYRYYGSYADYIHDHSLSLETNASSVSWVLGHELLVGHIGIDVEGLVHIYKPFFKTFSEVYERKPSELLYFLHRWLGARLGLNAYLFSPYDRPNYNVFLGAHLNTNNGEADFSGLSMGIEIQLNQE